MMPSSDIDLFSETVLDDPYDAYRELRELGPVVHLERLDMLAVARYDDVRTALLDADTFCSGKGVGLNEVGVVGARIVIRAVRRSREPDRRSGPGG